MFTSFREALFRIRTTNITETHHVIQSIRDNNLEELEELLKDNNINETYPCTQPKDLITPLIASVVYQKEDICTYLLQKGANPDVASEEGFTPLHYVSLSKAPLLFVEKLLEANANPNKRIKNQMYLPLNYALINDREDVMKALISAGALVEELPYSSPNDNKRLYQIVHKYASEGDVFFSKICYFLDLRRAVQKNQPEEVFKTFGSNILLEHPQTSVTIIETLFKVNGASAEKYRQGCIKWLKDTDSVDAYISSVIRRFPNVMKHCVHQVIESLSTVLCTVEEVQNKLACALIPELLELLVSEARPAVCEFILKTLYVITQKTKGKNDWDADFIERLCRTVAPFVNEKYSSDIRVFTYAIFGKLLSVENAVNFITSAGITSVPDDILTSADMKLQTDLTDVIRRLKIYLSKSKSAAAEPLYINTTATSAKQGCRLFSKRWQEKLEKLMSADESKVTRVGSMVFVKEKEFRIAEGSKDTEVFLGLRDDGTEVAIKRMMRRSCKELKNEEEFLRLPELDHPSIVRYVDYAEDEDFRYLGLQLCEYTLEEYIDSNKDGGLQKKKLVHEFLEGLRVLHSQKRPILHRDLKPQNVLIDVTGRARLADFGISRRLPKGQTTYHTGAAGTKCWKAKETLVEDADIPYKSSTDIQVAGMLIYYILSGGHHPFGDKAWKCENNIVQGRYKLDHVEDVVAKDLIEMMINEEPRKRPKVKECLSHPFFWEQQRREDYLIEVGDMDEVKQYKTADSEMISAMENCAGNGSFKGWKTKFSPELLRKVDSEKKPYTKNILGLLRFTRNLFVHYKEEAAKVDVLSLFPGLFGGVYIFARSQGWNSRPSLQRILERKESSTEAITTRGATSSTNPDEHVSQPGQETQTSTKLTEE
ncbi:uncharacterized protein LOC121521621 [Cheilinus undulatus]|uniref:uncharacterized protein LOC121521621 n=1 Tax=Cheilinus undulatus TaxID=241271 RepID=UPI001BD3B0B5|nr:uncharacterized protein LOC121521621 [Cheilinus undulatus]XP_041661672.1 uncharacterized protein LOC121521621 [Cheilinus undulatus]XP_041661673.1 uncharacterized protein LOC121521621 [Cheilinus undulatus]XP_041661674.1 uncharacterized protein LOC121521621 [Cheilinus undulatus]